MSSNQPTYDSIKRGTRDPEGSQEASVELESSVKKLNYNPNKF